MALPVCRPILLPSPEIHEQDESSTERKRGVIVAVTAVGRDRMTRELISLGGPSSNANRSQVATETSKHFDIETA